MMRVPESHLIPSVPSALLLEKEPSNLQAQSLSSLIERSVARGQKLILLRKHPTDHDVTIDFAEGYIGMALAGGAAALGTIVIASLIRRAIRD
jgi:fission 1 protein